MLKAKLFISLAVIAGIHQFNDASATPAVDVQEVMTVASETPVTSSRTGGPQDLAGTVSAPQR
ncbi:MAG: hypothetical protein JWQ88_757 [Rhodoferax sp.]|nr:hypothetical protein [Rhodoferax sp.]